MAQISVPRVVPYVAPGGVGLPQLGADLESGVSNYFTTRQQQEDRKRQQAYEDAIRPYLIRKTAHDSGVKMPDEQDTVDNGDTPQGTEARAAIGSPTLHPDLRFKGDYAGGGSDALRPAAPAMPSGAPVDIGPRPTMRAATGANALRPQPYLDPTTRVKIGQETAQRGRMAALGRGGVDTALGLPPGGSEALGDDNITKLLEQRFRDRTTLATRDNHVLQDQLASLDRQYRQTQDDLLDAGGDPDKEAAVQARMEEIDDRRATLTGRPKQHLTLEDRRLDAVVSRMKDLHPGATAAQLREFVQNYETQRKQKSRRSSGGAQ